MHCSANGRPATGTGTTIWWRRRSRAKLTKNSGMVVNIVDVDRVLKKYVTGPLADKHLNYDVPHFRDTPPTTENIARYLAERFIGKFFMFPTPA